MEARNPDGSSCSSSPLSSRSQGCDIEFAIATQGSAGVDGVITMVSSNPPALDYESQFQIYLAVTVTDSHIIS